MRLVVFSHKLCWSAEGSPSGYSTDGGFPFQMAALSELFDSTTLVVPCAEPLSRAGEIPLTGHNLSIAPLSLPAGEGLLRKLILPFWLLRNSFTFFREMWRADAVHTPIPGDIGSLGLIMAFFLRKPFFVRYCGNWLVVRTRAEKFLKWFIERSADSRNIAMATGGGSLPPSTMNDHIKWVFSTSLTASELGKYSSSNRDRTFSEQLRLIIVCRQERGKGVDVVINSMRSIMEEFAGATLDVVGDGRALDDLKKLSQSLGLQDRVIFHGKLGHDAVMHLLQESDIFCYPTSSEGFPKVVLEALAAGLPVITTRVSVLPDLIGDGCGVLIDETTSRAIASAVTECARNIQVYRSMSSRATQTAQKYSLERWREMIGDALKSAWGPLRSDA